MTITIEHLATSYSSVHMYNRRTETTATGPNHWIETENDRLIRTR